MVTRRALLTQAANGFGAVAFTALMAQAQDASTKTSSAQGNLHFPAKAKSVIFLYMDGGPSQVDTFDPKPLLTTHQGRTDAVQQQRHHLG
jgi:hypothetical protein